MIILSDIHANLTAFDAVIQDFKKKYPKDKTIICLGDVIGYGMRPNECLDKIIELKKDFNIVYVAGNHEISAIYKNYEGFSSERGKQSAITTQGMISDDSFHHKCNIHNRHTLDIDNLKVLCIHGSLENSSWKSIDTDVYADDYSYWDCVLSGHSHIPHFFQKACFVENNPVMRNKKFIKFINPGSVGQPRNHNINAQYAHYNHLTGAIVFNSVAYDIDNEMKLYDERFDDFYRTRLNLGI